MSNVRIRAVLCNWTVRNFIYERVAEFYVGAVSYIRLLVTILDYVSDHQLESACKDAIYIVPSRVTKMIFAVLEN